ncbi:MAG TPA: TRAP transporter small permease [Spirochaetia bacterium]|nr:TRAP transporter small permease [Spirochaetia bacterium]
MKEAIRRLLHTIERVEMALAKLFLVVMIVVVGMQVFFRYVVNRPLAWPEELSGFLLIWLTFLVADILVKRKGHVEVEYFFNKMSPKAQEIATIIINAYIIVFLIFLIVSSITIETVQIHHLVGAALKIPKAMYTMAATVSGASMLLSMFLAEWEGIEHLRSLLKKDS